MCHKELKTTSNSQIKMERSTSPIPNIQRALFKFEAPIAGKPNRKRSSRPSLDDDLKKASSSPLLGPDHDKENFSVPRRMSRKVFKSSCSSPTLIVVENPSNPRPRGLSARDANVFRFSSSQYEFSPHQPNPPVQGSPSSQSNAKTMFSILISLPPLLQVASCC